MTGYKFRLLGIALLFFCSGLSQAGEQAPVLVNTQHLLVNKILDVKAGQFIDEAALISRILNSEYLLLGENHDNRRHHQLEAQVIDWLRQQQMPASVSFEMITHQQAALVKQHSYTSSAQLIKLLNQEKNNWFYKRDYQVVFDSVIAAGFELLPANLNRKKISQIIEQGETKLPEEIGQMLTGSPLSAKQISDLQNEIVQAHCNMIPPEATKPMVLVQRVRDAVMSLSLLNSQADRKVLVAGAGHTRVDRGVPFYLHDQVKDARIVSLAFQEVKQEATHIKDYVERWDGQGLPFDYVWFTPAAQRADPCVTLKHRFKQQ